MKTTKIKMNVERLAMSGLVVAMLLLTGIVQAVEYKSSYRGVVVSNQQSVISIQTTAPSVSFQSTSAFSNQWSQDAQQSMLNADGTVNAEAYGVGSYRPGIRKGGSGSGYNPGTPDDDDEEEGEQQPLGDAVIPLLLLALAYMGTRVYRRKTT